MFDLSLLPFTSIADFSDSPEVDLVRRVWSFGYGDSRLKFSIFLVIL